MRIYLSIGILWMIRCFIINIVTHKDNYRKLPIYEKIKLIFIEILVWPVFVIIDVHDELTEIIDFRKEGNEDK